MLGRLRVKVVSDDNGNYWNGFGAMFCSYGLHSGNAR